MQWLFLIWNQNLLRWSLKHEKLTELLTNIKLEFTPLEFETKKLHIFAKWLKIRIYSVGV